MICSACTTSSAAIAWRSAYSARGLSAFWSSASRASLALRAGSCASDTMERAASSPARALRCSDTALTAAASEATVTSTTAATAPSRRSRARRRSACSAAVLLSRKPCTAWNRASLSAALPPLQSRTQAALGWLRCCQSRARSRLRPRQSSPSASACLCASPSRRCSSASASASTRTQPRSACHWRIRLSCEMSITGLLESGTSAPGTRKAVSARR